MQIEQVTEHKKQFLELLLLADEQEDMIDRYLERGDMYVLRDPDPKSVCVVTREGEGVYELKNIATYEQDQGRGYGSCLIEFLFSRYVEDGKVMYVGTGDSPLTVPFYQHCGFTLSHRVEHFFTDNYDHPIFEGGVQLVDMVYLKRNFPRADQEEEMYMGKIRWGILSTGTIAHNFAKTVQALGGEREVVAVASRSQEKAADFAKQYGIQKAYGSYEELAADPDVDVVYIATPHTFHYDNMVLCLEHGKHVLCEKSFTVSAGEARKAFALAREKGLFLMEAFWTKFLPIYREAEEAIRQGIIGEPRILTAQYGFCTSKERGERKFDPSLAGGALLDIGVYCIGFAAMFLGYEPEQIEAAVKKNQVGTDEMGTIILKYPDGSMAQLASAIQTRLPVDGMLYGSEGYMKAPSFKNPTRIEFYDHQDHLVRAIEKAFDCNGYEYEIREAEACIHGHRTSSHVMTPEQSIATMEIMDRVREIWGMKFPFEQGQDAM